MQIPLLISKIRRKKEKNTFITASGIGVDEPCFSLDDILKSDTGLLEDDSDDLADDTDDDFAREWISGLDVIGIDCNRNWGMDYRCRG